VREFSAQIFSFAVDIIDETFGKGYAMRNPNLLAATVQSVTDVYLSALNTK
jgi:hypothetical protein